MGSVTHNMIVLVLLVLGVVSGQDYGPVSLDSVDPLTLSWNEVHWLVKDQVREVEILKAEHNELYNELTACFGLEKCLGEFDLLNIEPGSKLHGLGLTAMDLSMYSLTRQREEIMVAKDRLDADMKERWRLAEVQRQELWTQDRDLAQQQQHLEAELAKNQASVQEAKKSSFSSSSSSSSSSSWSSRESGYSRGSGGRFAQGQPSPGKSQWSRNFFSNVSTSYGPKPEVYNRRYSYSSKNRYGTFEPTNQG